MHTSYEPYEYERGIQLNMQTKYRGRGLVVLILLVFTLLFVLGNGYALNSSSLTLVNGSANISYFSYDMMNSTYNNSYYGSNSYMDESPTNPNVVLNLCHERLKIGDYIDMVYATVNSEYLSSTLNFKPWVTSVTSYAGPPAYNCTTVNIDYSAHRALYPGYTSPLVLFNGSMPDYDAYASSLELERNTTNTTSSYLFPHLNFFFNGSYDIGVNIIGPPKTYLFSVSKIYDEQARPITTDRPFLHASLVNMTDNATLAFAQLSPQTTFPYMGSLGGGEKLYVNDHLALELKNYNPCDPINQSGYYIMNFSLFDYNESCVSINRTNDVVLNFAGEVLDGNVQNQSPSDPNYNTTCSVTISNSRDITLENFYAQNFYYGLCVENSTVLIYGTGAIDNIHGAQIYGNSTVRIIDLDFANNNSEIKSFAGGKVELIDVNFSTAQINSSFYDATVRAVPILPPLPHTMGWADEIWHINQFIEYERNSEDAYAQISFYYTEPLANGVVTNNVSIFKYSGDYITSNITAPNGSVYSAEIWSGGNWTSLFTLISPSERLIIGPLVTNFSVFAPFGYSSESRGESEEGDGTESGRTPEPDPDPDPEAGSTSGGGGTPARTEFRDILEAGPLKPLLIELGIPENITLMQGEAGEVFYNVTNRGEGVPEILTIGPKVKEGWDYTNSTIYELGIQQTQNGSFLLAPYEKTKPGRYSIPIHVYLPTVNGEVTVVKEFMHVYVTPRGDLRRIRITEYPPEIIVDGLTQQEITFQAKNIGDAPLNNIEVRLGEDGSECILDITGGNAVKIGEETSITYTFQFAEEGECNENIKFYEGEELIGFVPISFVIEDKLSKEELIKISIMSAIVLGWTALTIFVISRRRRRVA